MTNLTTPHCVLCGRPEDEAFGIVPPSFSRYLSSVGASRCPECGVHQGADLVDRAEVEGELADLRAEVDALHAEVATLRRWEAYAEFGSEFFSLREERDEALRLLATRVEAKRLDEAQEEIAALREACALALGIMEQKNRVAVLPTAKFVDVKFDPEDIAVLRAALEKKP
jgi:hypothetical protein